MSNPWQIMTRGDGQAMDERKEKGSARFQAALKRELIWRLIRAHLPEGVAKAVALEEQKREDPTLLGSGMEILFVARKGRDCA